MNGLIEAERDIRKIILEEDGLSEDRIRDIIEEAVFRRFPDMTAEEYSAAFDHIYGRLRSRLGALHFLAENRDINEIMINGPDNVFIEKDGRIEKIETMFSSAAELEDVIRNIAAGVRREINELNPILDARLEDGSRVNAVHKNIAIEGPVLTIRKFSRNKMTMNRLISLGAVTEECSELLKLLVRSGYNIFISGGTSSGKTTFLNALSDFIPEDKRVIVIEDSTELQLTNVDNLVQMECHNANSMGKGLVSMDMLIKTSLRMRPDILIIGEVRGREVADMLQALNTGHCGMSTGHGNSVRGMLRRLEAMYLMAGQLPMDAVRAQIVEALDIMVHLVRTSDGRRRVIEVQEIVGFDGDEYRLNPLFVPGENLELIRTGNGIVKDMKLKLGGTNR
ncbi:MAG TPA: Flp pilus assembly complex ATPase component TadA [Candidatus Avanaerovorax faecigallinarum]|nr:Flp pilus assembly complex ATPase component TadA [Candidatus Avanaerovorax faecigallinarum]